MKSVRVVVAFGLALAWVLSGSVVSAANLIRRPYLQVGTPTNMIIRWRTDVPVDSRVRFGPAPETLTRSVASAEARTEHELILTDLTPATKYFYKVGSAAESFAGGDSDYYFITAPPVGTSQSTRIWALGDPGTAGRTGQNASQTAVRDSYYNFTRDRHTDLWLLLGDNAYDEGTDLEYQRAIFDMYPAMLAKSVVWPSRGNHETVGLSGRIPYYDNFTMPTRGEAGGVASGTEAYYAFDYANIHFIALDAEASDLSPDGPMAAWLKKDLATTAQDWIISFWHHPPYSKGSHDSDDPTQTKLILMRRNIVPILEAGGVDLVLCGHSHSYERSFLLDGHYGFSESLSQAMIKDTGSGRADVSGPYRKPLGVTANEGAVYVVAGSSGSAQSGPLNHPAMYTGVLGLGSVVADVEGNRLDLKFIRETGTVFDYFSIVKEGTVPTVRIIATVDEASEPSSPVGVLMFVRSGDTSADLEVDFTVSGNATDGVDYRSLGSKLVIPKGAPSASLSVVPLDDSIPEGKESVTVSLATNARYRIGAAKRATVILTDPKPTQPENLSAIPVSGRQVDLSWTDSRRETAYDIERKIYPGNEFFLIGSAAAGATRFSDVGLQAGERYEYRIRGRNAAGFSPYSRVVEVRPPITRDAIVLNTISGGVGHSILRNGDGTIWSWGRNSDGQLGVDSAGNALEPTQVWGIDLVHEIAAGYYHSFALDRSSVAWAFGDNGYGQLGDGTASSRSSPVRVVRLSDVKTMAAGRYVSAAVKWDGSLWTWGFNQSGQLGDGTMASRTVPGEASTFGKAISAVALGRQHLLALKYDGSVWSAGSNRYGQLGTGDTNDSPSGVQVGGLSNIVRVAAGDFHSAAIAADGAMWLWGRGHRGQLGAGDFSDRLGPERLTAGATFADVAAGASHTVALTATGEIWTWGENGLGQLGDGSTQTRSRPQRISLPSPGIAIGAGANHSLAITQNGAIWAWGDNSDGQCGESAPPVRQLPAQVNGIQFARQADVPPSAPTDLRATAGDTRIELAWRSVPSATKYLVKRSRSSAGPFNTIATVSLPEFIDRGLVNGRTYFYVVAAANAVAESAASNMVSATPGPALPPRPPGTVWRLTFGNGEVRLEFHELSAGTYLVEASSDLRAWSVVTTAEPTNGMVRYTEATVRSGSPRFYRIRMRSS